MYTYGTVEMIYTDNSHVTGDFQHFFLGNSSHTVLGYIYIYMHIYFHEISAGKISPAITDIDSWGSLEMSVNLAISVFILNFVSFLRQLQA